MRTLVTLPSYNESENIGSLMKEILNLGDNYWVCVIDDNSPDETAKIVKKFINTLPSQQKDRVYLNVRTKKDGRGSAVRDGIEWGLKQSPDFEIFVEMDCDFSHPPSDIVKGVQLLENADVVLGSRYPEGTIIGWPLKRRIFSFLANLLARTLIHWSIADYTNGFRFYSRSTAEYICQVPQRHKGYIFLSETLTFFLKRKLVIKSFPIVFVNRERGKSNTDYKEILSGLIGILVISWRYHFSD